MFTGLIEATAKMETLKSGILTLEKPDTWKIMKGESIAVNGCCLSVTEFDEKKMSFDVSPETIETTSLSFLSEGSAVNLERAMPADGRFGGHMVLGHVDTKGEVANLTVNTDCALLRVRVSRDYAKLIIKKGSITVDGISLTVNHINDMKDFSEVELTIIPETLRMTNLEKLNAGSYVNLEFDVLGKYVHRIIAMQTV